MGSSFEKLQETCLETFLYRYVEISESILQFKNMEQSGVEKAIC